MDYVMGVDLGGTKLLTAVADLNGNILSKIRKETKAQNNKNVIIQQIRDSIYEVVEEIGVKISQIKGIGIGIPGTVSITNGLIKSTPNLNLNNVRIVDELSDLGVPIFLENDANVAALGEKYFGAAKGIEDLIYITISTGIGGGIIINNKIVHGSSDGAGEIGHMTLVADSEIKCGCGNYGCWEALASGTAIGRMGREEVEGSRETIIGQLVEDISRVDGSIVAESARKGDGVAKEIFEKVGKYNGIAIANLINIFNPKVIIVGGGVIQSWDLLEDEVWKNINERAMDSLLEDIEIIPAILGTDVGVLGAIARVLTEFELL